MLIAGYSCSSLVIAKLTDFNCFLIFTKLKVSFLNKGSVIDEMLLDFVKSGKGFLFPLSVCRWFCAVVVGVIIPFLETIS